METSLFRTNLWQVRTIEVNNLYIVYVIESAAYGVLFTSCLCQKPERARYERVRAFDTNNEWINPVQSTFYVVSCLLHKTREFSLN